MIYKLSVSQINSEIEQIQCIPSLFTLFPNLSKHSENKMYSSFEW